MPAPLERNDCEIKELGLERLYYRFKELSFLLGITYAQYKRILKQYDIMVRQDKIGYRAKIYIRRDQAYEIAEILRLEREGNLTTQGVKKKLELLREARGQYTFMENGVKYRYGRKAGRHNKSQKRLREMGAMF